MSKMSEQKRVAFTTLSSTVSASGFGVGGAPTTASTASLRFGGDLGAAQEKDKTSTSAAAASKGNNKTIRLKLELFQTDSCSYPEFNYSKLVHLQKKKLKKLKQKTNGFASDPFAENDDDVARIAKELEQKYGTGYAIGRGRSKKDDHCDIGLGYDESDSFIDNTEAYDEVIPEEVETVGGGFYINCGALEFKKLHTESTTTKTDEIIKMPNRPKKRVLSSSSEDSSSSDDDDDDKDDDDDDDGDSMEEPPVAKAKPKSNTSAPAEKRRKNAAAKTPQENGNKKKDTTSSSNSPKPSVDELNSDSEKRQKLVKTTTVKDMLKAKRDSFLKGANGEIKGAAANKSSDDDSSSEESDDTANQSDSTAGAAAAPEKKFKGATVTEENSEKLRLTDTKIPELEAELMAGIQEFKETVKSKSISGKKFIFDDKLTEVFLRIDESLLCIDKTQRNMVFAHLEYFLQLPKYYFLRKAKQLRIKEEKNKSKRALGKLRKTIIETMPGAIANYEMELRKNVELASGNLNSDQPPKMPKKKFPWNSNIRNLLYDVYQVRWTSYPVLGTRKETLESFINVYMKDKVVELWPNGWMRFEELQKEIEKRKQAAKKAKEKKKDSLPSAAASTSAATASVQGAASTAAATTSSLTYLKQFEEFATSSSRSCANSDTDSVASSGGPINLKRKNAIDTNKQVKFKSMKNNGEQQQPLVVIVDNIINNNNNSDANMKHQTNADTALDLISPSKRTDHSIHHIISNASPTPSPATSTSSATTSQSQQQKHSKSVEATATTTTAGAHIIDLDNYKTASDIIQTSKQLMNATAMKNHQQRSAAGIPAHLLRRDSSSESDGVEIVGVFPAKPMIAPSKQKFRKNNEINQNSRSNTPINNLFMDAIAAANAQYAASVAASTSSTAKATSTSVSNNNNNNNNNHNKNKKPSLMLGSGGGGGKTAKELGGGGVKLPEFDVNTVVKMLKDIEEAQLKQKPTLTPQNASTKEPNQ